MRIAQFLVSLAVLASLTMQNGCSGGMTDNSTDVDATTISIDADHEVDAPMTLDAGTPDAQTITACYKSWQRFSGATQLQTSSSTSPNATYMTTLWEPGATSTRMIVWDSSGEMRLNDTYLSQATCPYRAVTFITGTANGYLAETCQSNGTSVRDSLVRLSAYGEVEHQSPLALNMNGFASAGTSTDTGEIVAGATWHFMNMSANIRYGEVTAEATVPVAHSIDIPFAGCHIMGGVTRIGSTHAIATTYFDLLESKAHLSLFFQNGTNPAYKVDVAQPVPVADLNSASCYQFYEVYSISALPDGRVLLLWGQNSGAKSASFVSPNGETATINFSTELTDLTPIPEGYMGAYQDRFGQRVGAIRFDSEFNEIKRWIYPSNIWRTHSWETPKLKVLNSNRFMLGWPDATSTANLIFHDECIIVD